jgi:hypothetical protein
VDDDPEIEFRGAKSDTFTIFTRGTQENANECVQWAERGCDFLEFVLPDEAVQKWDVRKKIKATWGWQGYIWTRAEQKALIALNPEHDLQDDFINCSWVEDNRIVSVTRALTPASMHDNLVARVFHEIEGNDATLEGFMHASTWIMRATAITRYGARKTGTTAGERADLPDAANWWLRKMRDQATARTDFPANGLPRVQLADFRNDARIKTWSYGLWMLARFPEQWFHFLHKLPPAEKRPFPNVIDDLYPEIFGKTREEIEEEWRGWAAGRTLASYATGYGPPLLPEAPGKDQLRALERMNEFRAILDLPPCEIDLEATLACREHALFLRQNPDHWKWPEAHEEDPAKPGFSTRGMRAGLQSVIILSPDGKLDAAESLDGWMGTPYHRFPLLEPNIRRIGFALEDNVAVLDMGSLEEARNPDFEEKFRFVQWPCPGLEGVPLSFHAREEPDPLADTPEGKKAEPFELQREAGYPISMQFARFITLQIEDAAIEVWKAKKMGKEIKREERVACWVHTPKVPLLKRQENPGVVFAIPKQRLEPRQLYEVEVILKGAGGNEKVVWHFETGTQRTGHGRLKIKKDD